MVVKLWRKQITTEVSQTSAVLKHRVKECVVLFILFTLLLPSFKSPDCCADASHSLRSAPVSKARLHEDSSLFL